MRTLNASKIQLFLLFIIPLIGSSIAVFNHFACIPRPVGHSWQLGDYLINYQAGFTRRGLLGSALLAWERWVTPVDLLMVTGLLTLLTLCAITGFVAKRCSRTNPLDGYILCFSPALYSMFLLWDPEAAGRKDMLSLLFILISLRLYDSKLKSGFRMQIFVGLVLLPCLILTHEASFFFCLAPFLCILLAQHRDRRSRGRSWVIATVIALPSVAALVASYSFSAPHYDGIVAICESWQRPEAPLSCDPPPAPLLALHDSEDFVESASQSWQRSKTPRRVFYALFYVSLFALFPLARTAAANCGARLSVGIRISVASLVAVCIIPTVPLYLLGLDHGRWFVVAFSIALIMALNARLVSRMAAIAGERWPSSREAPRSRFLWLSRSATFALALVPPLYLVPHCCGKLWKLQPIWERF